MVWNEKRWASTCIDRQTIDRAFHEGWECFSALELKLTPEVARRRSQASSIIRDGDGIDVDRLLTAILRHITR